MTDETKKIEMNEGATAALDTLTADEGATQAIGGIDVGKTDVMEPVDTGNDDGEDGNVGTTPDATDTSAVDGGGGGKKPVRKGLVAGIAAVAIIVIIAGCVAIGSGATSGAESGSSAAASAATTSSSSTPKSSASSTSASSASASSSSASASASSASSAAAADGSALAQSTTSDTGTSGATGGGTTASSGGTDGGGTTSNTSTGGTTQAAKPAEKEKVWVPNIVTVVDQEAWDEPVYGTETHNFCSICGDIGFESLRDHGDSVHPDEYFSGGSRPVQVQTGTIHHDAVTHTEDQGHWE